MRAIACLAVWVAALPAQPASEQSFEVASIKPTAPGQYSGSSGIATGHGRLTGNSVTLKRCIVGAYGVGPDQVIGGPPWIDTDRFEIAAKANQPVGDAILMVMLRGLLAERFHLQLHRETRTLEGLALEVSRNGHRMQKAEEGDSNTSSSHGRIVASSTGMKTFAQLLSRQTGFPVVDQTGLSEKFDFTLEWSPESDRPLKPGETDTDRGPSLFTAIQQQLGLRLQPRKMPVEVLVIDHTEAPTAN